VQDEDGYFWYVSREDDVITTAGYRVGPSEIEHTLMKHPSVAMSAVVGIPDPVRTESIKAWIVLRPGYTGDEALAREIQEFVKVQLAAHEYPRFVQFVETLPMTATGKVLRRELRALGEGRCLPYLAPLLSAEARLRAKADAGRGRRALRAAGEGDSPHIQYLWRQPLTPTLSPRRAGRGRGPVFCRRSVAANDRAAILFRRESLGARIASALFHRGSHPDSLDRTYLAKTGTSDHESAGLGARCDGFLSFGHGLEIARITSRGMPAIRRRWGSLSRSPITTTHGVFIPIAFSSASICGGGPILISGACPVSSTLFRLERIAGQPWRPPARISSLSGLSCDWISVSFTTSPMASIS
jgi:AMP-binding enzyme C-terminal domain